MSIEVYTNEDGEFVTHQSFADVRRVLREDANR